MNSKEKNFVDDDNAKKIPKWTKRQ